MAGIRVVPRELSAPVPVGWEFLFSDAGPACELKGRGDDGFALSRRQLPEGVRVRGR